MSLAMNTKIETIIRNFVEELTAALQATTHEAISAALNGGAAGSAGGGRQPKPAASKPAARASGKRTRRSEADVQGQLDQIVAFLKKSKEPSGAEVIGKTLGLSTSELASPIKLGLSSKTLKRTGKLRGTKYSLK